MKKLTGYILGIGGLIGVIYFSYRYYQETESFSVFGADVTVSSGDLVPILISVVVLLVGALLIRNKR